MARTTTLPQRFIDKSIGNGDVACSVSWINYSFAHQAYQPVSDVLIDVAPSSVLRYDTIRYDTIVCI